MKKYSKFKKRLAAFLAVNGALGWLIIFCGLFMVGNYIAYHQPVSDIFITLYVASLAYGLTSYLVAMIFVGIPLMLDAMKGDNYWKRQPEYRSIEINQASYVAYHLNRTDKGTAIDVLIVSNNLFWVTSIYQSIMTGFFNHFILFIVIALVSTIPTILFVIKPISKYISEKRTLARNEKVYGEHTSGTDDKYRMK